MFLPLRRDLAPATLAVENNNLSSPSFSGLDLNPLQNSLGKVCLDSLEADSRSLSVWFFR